MNNRILLGSLFLFFSMHIGLLAKADSLRELEKVELTDAEPIFPTFPISWEFEIGKASPLLKQVPKGFYISVGSERSFRGASMADANGLLIMDISPQILRFARINRELLHANDLGTYLSLRYNATFADWSKFQDGYCPTYRMTAEDHAWWVSVNHKTKSALLTRLGTDDQLKAKMGLGASYLAKLDGVDFRTGNYLSDESLYNRLHQLAIADKIYVIQIDLSDLNAVENLVDILIQENIKIGVLDFNTLQSYLPDYPVGYFQVLTRFKRAASHDSALFYSNLFPDRSGLDIGFYDYHLVSLLGE